MTFQVVQLLAKNRNRRSKFKQLTSDMPIFKQLIRIFVIFCIIIISDIDCSRLWRVPCAAEVDNSVMSIVSFT
jgi:hypothetical protein